MSKKKQEKIFAGLAVIIAALLYWWNYNRDGYSNSDIEVGAYVDGSGNVHYDDSTIDVTGTNTGVVPILESQCSGYISDDGDEVNSCS